MNQQAGKVRIVGRDKEKEMLARLSWLLLDAGTTALKKTFDSIHPPAVLREHLMQPHVKAILQRLLSKVGLHVSPVIPFFGPHGSLVCHTGN